MAILSRQVYITLNSKNTLMIHNSIFNDVSDQNLGCLEDTINLSCMNGGAMNVTRAYYEQYFGENTVRPPRLVHASALNNVFKPLALPVS